MKVSNSIQGKNHFWLLQTLVKKFSVESGGNGCFRHETTKVIALFFTDGGNAAKHQNFSEEMLYILSVLKLMFSALKAFHFTPCFAIFFSTENINTENVSLFAVFRRIFQC